MSMRRIAAVLIGLLMLAGWGIAHEAKSQQNSNAVATSGGLAWSSAILANTTNSTSVKATFGQAYVIRASNNNSTIAYLKLYDSATAPTCGSGTPKMRVMIPAAAAGGTVTINAPAGIAFGSGIGYCVTTGIADNDTAAPAATTYIVEIGYK